MLLTPIVRVAVAETGVSGAAAMSLRGGGWIHLDGTAN